MQRDDPGSVTPPAGVLCVFIPNPGEQVANMPARTGRSCAGPYGMVPNSLRGSRMRHFDSRDIDADRSFRTTRRFRLMEMTADTTRPRPPADPEAGGTS